MNRNYWKHFNIYERSLAVFFMINMVYGAVIINNTELIVVPSDIYGYSFWLSLGLYLGFRLCRYEFTRVWSEMRKDEEQGGEQNATMPAHKTKLKVKWKRDNKVM